LAPENVAHVFPDWRRPKVFIPLAGFNVGKWLGRFSLRLIVLTKLVVYDKLLAFE
jgi:hypothetical protein